MARIRGRVSINGKNRFSSVFCTFGRAVLVETWISSFANDNPIDYMVLRPEAKSQPIWRIEDNDIAAQLRFIWIFLTYPYKLSFTSSLIRAGSFITDAVRAAHCARTVRWSHFFFFFFGFFFRLRIASKITKSTVRNYISDGEPDLWQTAKNKYQTETCTDEISSQQTKQKHRNKWRSRQDLDLRCRSAKRSLRKKKTIFVRKWFHCFFIRDGARWSWRALAMIVLISLIVILSIKFPTSVEREREKEK